MKMIRIRKTRKSRYGLKGRLEAFSDAIIAITITVMALQLPLPRKNNFEELKTL